MNEPSSTDTTTTFPAPNTYMRRQPASVFLSHWRGNAAVISLLQRELQLRGVRAWRDTTNLEYGEEFKDALRRAIRDEVSAFIAYVTPDFLTRAIIWDVEVPEALNRHGTDPHFQIIPLFSGVAPAELTAKCASLGLKDLSDFNGEFVPRRGQAKRAAVIKTVAARTLRSALRPRLMADNVYEPRVLLRAEAHTAAEPGVDLDLDWTEPFIPGCPSPEAWATDLMPSLRDIRDVLSANSRRLLHVEVQARLPAAIAFGEVFNSVAKYTLTVSGRNGAWSTASPHRSVPVLRREDITAPGNDRATGLVEVSISRAIGRSVEAHAAGLDVVPGHAVRLVPVDGPGLRAVEDASWAITAAWQVGECMRALHDEQGAQHIHLYVAAPAEWCVLLGHTLNATGRITVHQMHPVTREYVRACTLGATGT